MSEAAKFLLKQLIFFHIIFILILKIIFLNKKIFFKNKKYFKK